MERARRELRQTNQHPHFAWVDGMETACSNARASGSPKPLPAVENMTHNVRSPIRLLLQALVFAMGLTGAHAASILIDFGGGSAATTTDAVGRVWNNISESNDLSGSPHTLNETGGTDSGFRLTISNVAGVTSQIGFNGANGNGVGSTAAPLTGAALARNYPLSATRDSLYGNTVAFGNGTVQSVRLVVSNLNPDERYSFDFFASRLSAGGDNREAEYLVTGGLSGTAPTSVFLNASENSGNIVGVTGFAPDANNQIIIDIDGGPNNTNSSGFFYLGVLEITSVPEPATAAVLALGGGLLLARRRRH